MNEKEIRERFAARKVNSQVEFDAVMNEMNTVQTKFNHPHKDRKLEIIKQRELLNIQKQAINQQLSALSAEYQDIEMKQKEINRVFYELKHDFLLANPKGLKNETATC